MKKLVLLFAFFASTNVFAAPQFSAFALGKELFVTVIGDSCNNFGGQLEVAGLCSKDRMMANYATTCQAKLKVWATRMACGDKKPFPVVMTINLEESQVAREAEVLELSYGGETINVRLK